MRRIGHGRLYVLGAMHVRMVGAARRVLPQSQDDALLLEGQVRPLRPEDERMGATVSRPLIPDPKRQSESSAWHRAVFAAHGHACFFCGAKATDAMHVIPRSQLGKLRYAIPKENGRPGCRRCHEAQEGGDKQFPLVVVRAAIRAHNRIAKIAMMLP